MSNDPSSLPAVSEADYSAIEFAVMETARGRWFLKEFAARNRHADTTMLLGAINRLESTVSGNRTLEHIERIRFDLLGMAKAISGLMHELDTSDVPGPDRGTNGEGTSALEAIVKTTENATSDILAAAESIQEIAWHLRERQIDEDVCNKIDHLATEIYTACGFQDLTAQRTQKVVRTLRFLEGRINALMDMWGSPAAGGETHPSSGSHASADPESPATRFAIPVDMSQQDIDIVIVGPGVAGHGAPAHPERNGTAQAPEQAPNGTDAVTGVQADDMSDFAAVEEDPVGGHDPMPVRATGPFAALPDMAPNFAEDIMAFEDIQVVIDDAENLEIEFEPESEPAADARDEPLAEPDDASASSRPVKQAPVAAPGQTLSLAQIDALPTTAKVLIYG